MNYELYMRAALAEAAQARRAGERANGAVAVLDEAMVAHGREAVANTGDPTAHAVMIALREAATRLGRRSLAGMTVFCVVEPCPMCVGALLECDADGVVYALADPNDGACLSAMQLADREGARRRLNVVSGILQEDAADLRPDLVRERSGA
jgi:tRNA(adenine34) deaminase